MLKSSGIFVCNPEAKGIPAGQWWLILQCCPDLAKYCRMMINKYNLGSFKVMKPAWDSHISVTRGEEPKNKELWNSLTGREVDFYYENKIETNDRYYWLPVQSDAILDVREQLGLLREPYYKLHLTVAIQA